MTCMHTWQSADILNLTRRALYTSYQKMVLSHVSQNVYTVIICKILQCILYYISFDFMSEEKCKFKILTGYIKI